MFLVSAIIWFSFPWLWNNNNLMYCQFQMYKSWTWLTTKGNCTSETGWYIMGHAPTFSEFRGSTVPQLSCRAWLCFTLGLTIFWPIAWSLQFGSLPWLGLSSLLLTALWVLICLRQFWGLLNFWPERWYLQGSGTLLGCTALASCLISCTDP